MVPTGAALVSGEGVALDLRTAGVASRALAAGVDLGVQLAMLLVLTVLDSVVVGGSDDAAFAAVVLVELVLVLAGYPIVLEWLCGGRTVGKMALGLRVVRDDGGPIGFRQALVRGLAGLVLEKPGLVLPFSTFVAMGAISSNASEKRIGDLMAGTLVLNERAAPQPLAAPAPWVMPALRPWVLSLDLQRLDDRLALSVRQFVSRAWDMSPAGQHALGEELRLRVLDVVSPPPPPGVPTPVLLQGVLAERRRRAGEPVATWPAVPPTHHPFGPVPPRPYGPAPQRAYGPVTPPPERPSRDEGPPSGPPGSPTFTPPA